MQAVMWQSHQEKFVKRPSMVAAQMGSMQPQDLVTRAAMMYLAVNIADLVAVLMASNQPLD